MAGPGHSFQCLKPVYIETNFIPNQTQYRTNHWPIPHNLIGGIGMVQISEYKKFQRLVASAAGKVWDFEIKSRTQSCRDGTGNCWVE